ncbi:hypothetical protein C8R44DRAFT_876351 [Mycena epipterygia]|nr:hypothetical protein C8R44DRAFT_876351 [Mycena epipterygia]
MFEDAGSMPAQTHPVKLPPASLRDLSVWAYLALAFVIVSTIGVFCYAGYSLYHTLTLNDITPLPQYSPSKVKRSKKKAWRPSKSSSSQPMLSEGSMDHDSTYQFDPRMGLLPLNHAAGHGHIPSVAFPSAAVSPPAKLQTMPTTFDMHNIRFASPSNVAIYNNPKLAPVVGSAVPLSYESDNNLFANPFTPTIASRGEGTDERNGGSFSSAFRGKGKGKTSRSSAAKESKSSAKENFGALVGQGDVVALKRLY